jgi:NitT/TauT family transport system substrate-binding protein
MLAEGNVAAVTGFSFSSVIGTKRLGVPADDISNILMADYGVDLYGNAILVNTDWAEANPDVLKAFLDAVAKGWVDAVADPDGAIESLAQRNPAIDKELEKERLMMSADQNVMTDWVKANGMGGIDPARMESALAQIGTVYTFQTAPDASVLFTDAYLPEGGFKVE